MKQIKDTFHFLATEYHWRRLIRIRVKMDRLYSRGFLLSSPRMVRLGKRASRHCAQMQDGV